MTTTSWVLVAWLAQGAVADGGAAADGGVPMTGRAPLSMEVKALVDRVQAFYELTRDFTADFRQDYTYAASRRSKSSSGTVAYKRPAQMRWEYLEPSARTFVLSGERVYMHDPEAKLVTRAALGSHQLSASVTFLWGQGKLAEEFSITKKACPAGEEVSSAHPTRGVLLELVPLKPDPRFRKVLLEVDPKTAQVLKSTVVDPDGSVNAISFLRLRTNVGMDDQVFRLVPPPGTQVQDFLPPDAGAR